MAYDFPLNPTPGQEYIPPIGGQTYVWHSPRWLVKGTPPLTGSGGGSGIDEAPINGRQYGRKDATWLEIMIPSNDWDSIPNKPAVFPPSAHAHVQAEITGLTAALNAKEPTINIGTTAQWLRGDKSWQTLPASDWNTLTNKPSTFAPSVHAHVIADVTSLQTVLDGKALLNHAHAIAQITGLDAVLAGKEPTIVAGSITQYYRGDKSWQPFPPSDWITLLNKPTTFPPSVHSHSIDDVNNLQIMLDGKAPLLHTHPTSDVINLDAILGNKASLVHTHVQADITGLSTSLAGKSDVGHVHDYSTLTGIPSTFSPIAHAHTITDVTGLQTALDLKIGDAPNDGKEYVRKDGAWVVAALTPWQVNANGEAIIKFGANVVVRITAVGLILTENDIEVFSTTVG